ncbi:MAG: phosphocholine cytidylyltransferase family protein [Thermodesulfobacteriota bacterium]|nr:phosphocholine cytidylyltransferase family protein [Thermodesulfobacteriota bacterium]MEE2975379.1 phosphocholine cytidylyltransferase family protein [Thermodesulfobacteriota bacterium]|tara:strand:- start:3 stop:758 length:756 start_codon:yes stop_codon:yes gene_type:complete
MKAIILAAGKGKRLQPYTKNIPKCLLQLGAETILEHQINHLKSSEIQEINVVVGFGSEKVEEFLSNYDSLGIKINTIYNPYWESTNSLFSLWAARAELDSDVVVLNGDDVFELNVLKLAISSKHEITLPYKVKEKYSDEDMKIRIQDGLLTQISKEINKPNGESVGIRVFRQEGVGVLKRSLEKEIRTTDFNKKWYASAIERILQRGHKISVIDIADMYWHDVDYPHDLENAKENILLISNKKSNTKLSIV